MITILTIILIIFIIKSAKRKKARQGLYDKLCNIASSENVKIIEKNKAFDYEMLYNDRTYLVKLIYHPSKAEINVNSKLYWQINNNLNASYNN